VTADRPDGAALLAEARRTLLELLLPHLPAERRYDGLMVANAMAIAGRELDAGEQALRETLAALAAVLSLPEDAAPPRQRLTELEARLAADIRVGRYDAEGSARESIRGYLRAATVARVRLSNPKLLGGPASLSGG
jgi:hypothetical protein